MVWIACYLLHENWFMDVKRTVGLAAAYRSGSVGTGKRHTVVFQRGNILSKWYSNLPVQKYRPSTGAIWSKRNICLWNKFIGERTATSWILSTKSWICFYFTPKCWQRQPIFSCLLKHRYENTMPLEAWAFGARKRFAVSLSRFMESFPPPPLFFSVISVEPHLEVFIQCHVIHLVAQ